MNTVLNLSQKAITCDAMFNRYMDYMFGDEDDVTQNNKIALINNIYGDISVTDVDVGSSANYYLKKIANSIPYHIVICPNIQNLLTSRFMQVFCFCIKKTKLDDILFHMAKEKILVCKSRFIFDNIFFYFYNFF